MRKSSAVRKHGHILCLWDVGGQATKNDGLPHGYSARRSRISHLKCTNPRAERSSAWTAPAARSGGRKTICESKYMSALRLQKSFRSERTANFTESVIREMTRL